MPTHQNLPPYLQRIRNVGIIAHIDAGKTTLSERILFYTKKIHRMGEVHEGTATMDYLPEEQLRGITIVSACTSCEWGKHAINIIDTPGHVDFTIEVERSLRVLDGAVGVFCAVGGVEPQSETVWRQSEDYHVPKLAFINKMDRLGADFSSVIEEMKKKLQAKPVPLVVPIGEGETFAGLIDLLTMEKLVFDSDHQGASYARSELDKEELSIAQEWQERLMESLAEENEEILEAFLNEESVSKEKLVQCIRQATLSRKITPVFSGSALKNIGVQPLLDGIVAYLPSPGDVHDQVGENPTSKQKMSFPSSPDAPFSALAFKVTMETGRKLVLLRIYSGTVQAGGQVFNSTQEKEERIARLFTLHAGQKEKLEKAKAGQIVAAAGLRFAKTGDALCRTSDPIILEKITEYKPVISLALEPKNASEEEKLLEVLEKMLQEDPTLFLERDKDTEQIILSGMGELHLDVVLDRLKREYKVELRSGNPQVIYQETILGKAEEYFEFHKELGDDIHYGWVSLYVEKRARDAGNIIQFELDQSKWPKDWTQAIVQGIEDGLQSGVVKGYPVQDVLVRVLDMRKKDGQSSTIGYQAAAMQCMRQCLQSASPVLMEPLMWVEVFVPEEFVGDAVSLLGAKGAKIENMFDRVGQKVVQARTPLRQLFGFSTELRSATQGRAGLMMKFDRFDVLVTT